MIDDLILESQRLTSPSVKVRRLGYLVNIPSIALYREVSSKMLNAVLLDWANANRTHFNHYSLQLPVTRIIKGRLTGQIRTSDAASRYIKTCEEFGFIARLRGFRVSKSGRVISALSTGGNPFKLSLGQSFSVLKSLLEKDYDCISVLVEALQKKEKDKIGYFRSGIQDRLKLKIEKAKEMNRLYVVDMLRRHSLRLQKWHAAFRYYREVIETPRVEWMLDLNLVEEWNQRRDIVSFKEKAGIFFGKDLITREWLQDEFPVLFAKFYSNSFDGKVVNWSEFNSEEKLDMLNQLLSRSMNTFQTEVEIGRISADEFFEYAIGFLIQNKSIVASLSNIEEDLANFASSGKIDYRYVQTVSPGKIDSRYVQTTSHADRGYIVRV